jgi:hypothetical protein
MTPPRKTLVTLVAAVADEPLRRGHGRDMFGDMGIGHITQCPEHLDVVAFGWACG